jgi:glycosyltransferase involved in cell wall biosynthesis
MRGGELSKNQTWDWQIGVSCQNENGTIATCLESISAATATRRVLINILVNGSNDRSAEIALECASKIATPIRVFSIAYGDKSNVINCLVHDPDVRVSADYYFFIDGYVRIHPTALTAMENSLRANPKCMAVTGIATTGRSEPLSHLSALQRGGGSLHGQLFAFRRDFIEGLTSRGLRLPIGLYRGDGLLGSMAAHNLNSLGQPWCNARVICVPDALFDTIPLSPFRLRDLRRQLRRKVRQMRGRLENAAIKKVIYRSGYSALPALADDLISDFLLENPVPTVPWQDRIFMAVAIHQHRVAKPPKPESLRPIRLLHSGP